MSPGKCIRGTRACPGFASLPCVAAESCTIMTKSFSAGATKPGIVAHAAGSTREQRDRIPRPKKRQIVAPAAPAAPRPIHPLPARPATNLPAAPKSALTRIETNTQSDPSRQTGSPRDRGRKRARREERKKEERSSEQLSRDGRRRDRNEIAPTGADAAAPDVQRTITRSSRPPLRPPQSAQSALSCVPAKRKIGDNGDVDDSNVYGISAASDSNVSLADPSIALAPAVPAPVVPTPKTLVSSPPHMPVMIITKHTSAVLPDSLPPPKMFLRPAVSETDPMPNVIIVTREQLGESCWAESIRDRAAARVRVLRALDEQLRCQNKRAGPAAWSDCDVSWTWTRTRVDQDSASLSGGEDDRSRSTISTSVSEPPGLASGQASLEIPTRPTTGKETANSIPAAFPHSATFPLPQTFAQGDWRQDEAAKRWVRDLLSAQGLMRKDVAGQMINEVQVNRCGSCLKVRWRPREQASVSTASPPLSTQATTASAFRTQDPLHEIPKSAPPDPAAHESFSSPAKAALPLLKAQAECSTSSPNSPGNPPGTDSCADALACTTQAASSKPIPDESSELHAQIDQKLSQIDRWLHLLSSNPRRASTIARVIDRLQEQVLMLQTSVVTGG